MPPLTTRDWYIGCALQGLLAHPCRTEIEDDGILNDDEKQGLIYGDIVSEAIGIAEAIMQIRKDQAEKN